MTTTLDQSRSEAFAERLVAAFNDAALVLMISIGHRTRLLDLLAASGPVTSAELARESGLEERYVREWLGAMTTGRIVELDPTSERYALPAEHAAWLTRPASPDNLAVMAQYLGILGSVEDDVIACFESGGGVPYDRFGRFHEVMAEDSGQAVLTALDDQILPLVPGVTDRLEEGIRVADLGCGRGRALAQLARRFPRSSFVGVDLSAEAIAWATEATAELENVRYEVRDLRTFDVDAEPARFDFVTTFDAVHDQPAPLALLTGIRRSLAPGGVYLMQDIDGHSDHNANLDHPLGPFLYSVSCMHCMTVSLAQGGEGLGTMWGVEKADELLRAAGFETIDYHRLDHDPVNVYVVARP
ncbi:MAG TPA: class I SAM-dependent methyltransferase [Gaiella sp.]|nr:class I SAM-dependent methyltransferase [Gaiella sp.]